MNFKKFHMYPKSNLHSEPVTGPDPIKQKAGSGSVIAIKHFGSDILKNLTNTIPGRCKALLSHSGNGREFRTSRVYLYKKLWNVYFYSWFSDLFSLWISTLHCYFWDHAQQISAKKALYLMSVEKQNQFFSKIAFLTVFMFLKPDFLEKWL